MPNCSYVCGFIAYAKAFFLQEVRTRLLTLMGPELCSIPCQDKQQVPELGTDYGSELAEN